MLPKNREFPYSCGLGSLYVLLLPECERLASNKTRKSWPGYNSKGKYQPSRVNDGSKRLGPGSKHGDHEQRKQYIGECKHYVGHSHQQQIANPTSVAGKQPKRYANQR